MSFEEYAKRQVPMLLRTARAVSSDAGLAEDLVQDVLIKLHAKWALISVMDAPDAYVRRMLLNEFFSWRRKWARLIPHADPMRTVAGRAGERPDTASAFAERDALLNEVGRLPARQRAVIGLRYFVDLDDAQIAEALGCTQSTVCVPASRALAALRVANTEPSSIDKGGDTQ